MAAMHSADNDFVRPDQTQHIAGLFIQQIKVEEVVRQAARQIFHLRHILVQHGELQLQRLQAERDEARLDLENARDSRSARFQLLQTTITAVATLTTVVLTIATLNRSPE